jgi:excinuclease UvrABC nuclease subunit
MIAPLAAERDQASEQLAFESAKTLHEKVEKLKGIAREADELVRRIDQLDAVIIAPAAEHGTVALFRFNGCQICGPESHSLATREGWGNREWEEALQQLEATKKVSAAECVEHLAILKRWYYRSHKVGEIVFRNDDGSWPLRKLANACERVGSPRRHGDAEENGPSGNRAMG